MPVHPPFLICCDGDIGGSVFFPQSKRIQLPFLDTAYAQNPCPTSKMVNLILPLCSQAFQNKLQKAEMCIVDKI